jgi:hypothetical protein
MSKISELSTELDELRKCGETLISISETLRDMFSTDAEEKAVSEPKKEKGTSKAAPEPEKKSISLTDVRAVLAEKSRNGYTADVKTLLLKFGADKLSDITPDDYEALLSAAEVLGNG